MNTPTPRRLPGAARRRPTTERGSATIELVVAVPLLLLTLMLSVQVTLSWHAAHVADAAVTRGADAARLAGGTDSDGQAAAQAVLDELGSGLLTGAQVSVHRDGGQVTVVLTGHAPAVVPGLTLPLRRQATAPLEAVSP